MRLRDKVAVVTGGGKGIGRAYAMGLAGEGARVAVAEIDAAAAQQTAKEIEAAGGEALAVVTDVASETSVAAAMRQVVDHFGRIDVLVNNAALFAEMPRGTWDDLTLEAWDQVMAVNLRGVFLCCRAAVPAMRERGGSIINISSATVLTGGLVNPHYVASKAGVMALTRSFARLLGEHGIRVNTLAPGRTASDTFVATAGMASFTPSVEARALKRLLEPGDLVGTVIFLASDDSAMMTGQMLVVDGGSSFH
jgi:3-oxoacyl-[acyl-carrier protein] reductase